ncbi:MAG TPA: hypothetical protein VII99_03790, partial [Bacteroidia bacterium]
VEYSALSVKLNILQSDLRKKLTYTNVVLKPVPSYKKAYPIRWLIVTVSVFAALFFALILIMIIEGKNNIINKE